MCLAADETQTEALLEQAYQDLMLDNQTAAQTQQPLIDSIYWTEITSGFEAFLAKYKHHEATQARLNAHPTFSQHASELFQFMLDNQSNKTIAARLGISTSAVMQWKTKLTQLAQAWHWLQGHPEARST